MEIQVLSTIDLSNHYLCCLPEKTLGLDMLLWRETRYDAGRAEWARRARTLMSDIFACFPFDVVLGPADDTAYFRDVIAALYELGVPYVMLVKEVLRPPFQFETWGPQIRAAFPVIASHVLVNSEMNRRYIVETGGRPDRIWITGQPRFDIYGRRHSPLKPTQSGQRRHVLFLSYEIDVYMPLEVRQAISRRLRTQLNEFDPRRDSPGRLHSDGIPTWGELRVQTLQALGAAVQRGEIALTVKPHPQMTAEDQELDRKVLKSICGDTEFVHIEHTRSDTRELIYAADLVVGFQTTALLEAVAAGRPVIYTWWTATTAAYEKGLMPYHNFEPVFSIARSATELAVRLPFSAEVSVSPQGWRETVERWIGPLDGRAGERVWERVQQAPKDFDRAEPSIAARRRKARSGRHRFWLLVSGACWLAMWWACSVLTFGRGRRRVMHANSWLRTCWASWVSRTAPSTLMLPIPPYWRDWAARFSVR